MIVKGGTLITPNGFLRADLVTSGEKIQAVRQDGVPDDPETPAVDATGLWVLPGGVDAHTHFGMPLDSELHSLGWRDSSTAALLGGTTTVVDFANPERGEPLAAAVARWREMADGGILCDYGLHCTVIDTSPDRLAEIPVLATSGVPSFKGFLAYPGRLMLEAAAMKELMKAVKTTGGLLLVHAEDGLMNAAAQDVLLNAGRIGPRYHPLAHPEEAETRAVARVLAMARETSCPLEIVHMSLAQSVQLLLEARATDPRATLLGEVCLHHLLAESGLYESGFEPALAAICSPPLRPAGNGAVLREALARGDLDLLSTDHCEFPLNIKSARAAGGFHLVPNGCGGVGERLVFSFTELVEPGLIRGRKAGPDHGTAGTQGPAGTGPRRGHRPVRPAGRVHLGASRRQRQGRQPLGRTEGQGSRAGCVAARPAGRGQGTADGRTARRRLLAPGSAGARNRIMILELGLVVPSKMFLG